MSDSPRPSCLFCGGDASEPDHLKHCDGRQGFIEALEDPIADTLVRSTDPSTSRAAAKSIIPTATEVQARVFSLHARRGPMTDEELLAAYQREHGVTAESSPRKRRNDLTKAGWIEDSGERRVLKSKRMGIVWRIVVKAVGAA